MAPKRRTFTILCCAFAAVAFTAGEAFTGACIDAPLEDPEAFAAACVRTSVEEPSKLSWILLSKICELGAGAGAEPQCDWQRWATNDDTFPADPWQSNPRWPTGGDATAAATDPCKETEKRRNRAAFDYIVEQELWYLEGLTAAWKKDLPQIEFPRNAIEVDASWKSLGDEDSNYHLKTVETDHGPVKCGLTGLDVKVKILPNWFWFTFEHVGNTGRCDYIGCYDDFGMARDFWYIPPNPNTNADYPAGELSDNLLELIPMNEVWRRYRLKGTQTDFVEATGRPTFLGNSHLEGPIIPASSSCITCHAQAGFDRQGNNLRGHGFVGPLQVAAYGVPDPGWFYDTAPTRWELRYLQADFNWAIPLHVCPKKCPEEGGEDLNDGCLACWTDD